MNGLGQEDKWVLRKWTLAERFGANVVWFRHQAGLTQQELADRVGMNRVSLGALERGRRLPRLDTILRLVAGLEVENCDLLAWMWWDPARHFHYETPPSIADSSGYAVRDFDLPAGFRISSVGYETKERFEDRLRQRGEDPDHRDVLDALRDDTPRAPRHEPPDESWLQRAGAALRALREERRMTRQQLAERARTTAAFIEELEEARCSNPALRMFTEICAALDGDNSELSAQIEQLRAPREAAREEWMRAVRKAAGRDEVR